MLGSVSQGTTQGTFPFQLGNGVLPFFGARTTVDLTLIDNVDVDDYIYSNEEVVVGNIVPVIDSYTKLMLHMDGANASTVFTDSEFLAKTVTKYGDAQISTAQSKFGGASAYFDGTGDYLTVPQNADFNFGSGDFTIDCWYYQLSRTTGEYDCLWSFGGSALTVPHLGLYISAMQYDVLLGSGTGGAWTFNLDIGTANLPSMNAWHHIAFVRNGTTFTLYLDGASIGSTTSSASVADFTLALTLGGVLSATGTMQSNCYFNGYIDEFRISKGIARWTSNFTPPTSPYEIQSSGQLIPAIGAMTTTSQIKVVSSGALKSYGVTAKKYMGFSSKVLIGAV